MLLTELNEMDKKQYLHELKDYVISYRDNLNIRKKQTFGIEIEFMAKREDRIDENQVKSYDFKFYDVYEEVGELSNFYQGEMVSLVFHDDCKSWKKIKKMCEYLQQNKAFINDLCGGHIHIGSQALLKNVDLNRFIKLWGIFEDIIYYFSYGEQFTNREVIDKYAAPMAFKIDQFLLENHKLTIKNIHQYFGEYKENAVEFTRMYQLKKEKKDNTIEFRCPNGTLNPIIWQNNINFFMKLLLKCNHRANWDIIDRYVRNGQFSTGDLEDYQKINIEKAMVLNDFLFEEEVDQKNFMKQYIKDDKKITY